MARTDDTLDRKGPATRRKEARIALARPRRGQIFVYVLIGALLVLSPSIAALLVVGLMPTLIMLLVDAGPHRAARINTMFAFNVAGVLPFVERLWREGESVGQVMVMLGDITIWAIMYGSAFLGAAMLWVGPVLASGGSQILNNDRVRKLEVQRNRLVEEWGEAVRRSSGNADG